MQTTKQVRKRQNWKELVDLWKSASMSKAEFCRQNNVPSSSFYKALKQLKSSSVQQEEIPQFVKAQLIDTQPSIPQRSNQGCVIEFSNKARMTLPNISSKFLRDLLMGD